MVMLNCIMVSRKWAHFYALILFVLYLQSSQTDVEDVRFGIQTNAVSQAPAKTFLRRLEETY